MRIFFYAIIMLVMVSSALAIPTWWNNADINHDCSVGQADLNILQAYYNQPCSAPSYCNLADINRDGIVDVGDLGILAGVWGESSQSCTPTHPVPEFTTIGAGLALVGAGTVYFSRRKK